MKTLIIYFSQTGNTLKAAESIRDGIKEISEHCDLVPMNQVDTKSLGDYDLVGFGCPVFYFKEPFNVSDFITNLPELKDKRWFVFCSHGAVMGVTLHSMTENLEKKGIKVIGSYDIYADASIPFYPRPTFTTGHPDEQDLKEAADFGRYIVKCSNEVSNGNMDCIKKPAPITEDWSIAEAKMFSREILAGAMPKLSINTGLCTKCGACADSCPVNGIDITADPQRIQNPCVYCWHCSVVCPESAIETDWSLLVSMAPENYKRYAKALYDAEARGEFRWLMDPDSIKFDDPLCKQLKRKSNRKVKS